MEIRFGASAPYTAGAEEEFQLVDPSSRELAQAIEDVIGAVPDGSELVTRELFQDCVEMCTPVFSTVAELARQLPALRLDIAKAAEKAGVGLAASGLHPISDPYARRFSNGECYEWMDEELGALARLQIIYALHVHVAVPDGAQVQSALPLPLTSAGKGSGAPAYFPTLTLAQRGKKRTQEPLG
jgi:carboxylate-amine ligase